MIIYSGINRPIDIGYINPISSHLEIELNDRLNILGTNSANAVWQIHFDWLIKERLRLSGNFLYDEFVIDKVQKEKGEKSSKAYSAKAVITPLKSKFVILTVYTSLNYIGTTTA